MLNGDTHGRCNGCKDCKVVHCNGGYCFLGCYHKPYRGKWVGEIKDCPQKDGERRCDNVADK